MKSRGIVCIMSSHLDVSKNTIFLNRAEIKAETTHTSFDMSTIEKIVACMVPIDTKARKGNTIHK